MVRYNERFDIDDKIDINRKKISDVIQEIDTTKAVFRQEEAHPTRGRQYKANYDCAPYYQIGYNGLFISTLDLFQMQQDIRKDQGLDYWNPLSTEEKFVFSMFYLNKINGIKKVTQDRIEFFNGDIYQLIGKERAYCNCVGNYFKKSKVKQIDDSELDKGIVFWDRLFSSVNLCKLNASKMRIRSKCFDKSSIDRGSNAVELQNESVKGNRHLTDHGESLEGNNFTVHYIGGDK